MTRRISILIGGLVMVFICVFVASAGPDRLPMPVPTEQVQTVSPQSDRIACTLTRTSGTIAYFYAYEAGMQTVTYFDPTGFCPAPVYPLEITAFWFTLYGPGGYVWPVTVDVVVYSATDSCSGVGPELCRATVQADQASFGFPAIGMVNLPTPCCVYGPFYIGVEYVTGVVGSTPSVIFDNASAVDTCVNWMFQAGAWTEWYDLFGADLPGYPMFWVDTETESPNCPDICFWNVDDPHKMHHPQLPDEDGWDVNATYPIVLADDFLCTDSGYIEDIHFWGSWRYDDIGEILSFWLSIHQNIPEDQNPAGYSLPGLTLWEMEVPIEWVHIVPIDPPTAEGWYDPSIPEAFPDDHWSYFQYNVCLYNYLDTSQMFYQYLDSIYWLNISAVVADPVTLWGWKNSEDHWMDDAVWAYSGELDWQEIYEPGGTSDPITNDFWIEFDAAGAPVATNTGGTDYYDDGTSLNGWYYYANTGWWNIWFYDHPFDPTRYKDIYVDFQW